MVNKEEQMTNSNATDVHMLCPEHTPGGWKIELFGAIAKEDEQGIKHYCSGCEDYFTMKEYYKANKKKVLDDVFNRPYPFDKRAK